MGKREIKIVRAIVTTSGEQTDDYKRLRPIQNAYWNTQYPVWVYEPDPDFIEYMSHLHNDDFLRLIRDAMMKYPYSYSVREIASDSKILRQYRDDVSNNKHIRYVDFRAVTIFEMQEEIEYWILLTEVYNIWVRKQQEELGAGLVAQMPVDKDGNITSGDVKEAWADMPKQYRQAYVPDLWDVEIQVIPPSRKYEESEDFNSLNHFTDLMGVYSFHDKALHCAVRRLGGRDTNDFVKYFNLMLYDHIQDNRKIAEEGGGWNKDNNYWLPNMEFIHYFQKEGIDPKIEDRFWQDNDLKELFENNYPEEFDDYSEKAYAKIFGGHQDFNDDSVTLKDLAWKCRAIVNEYPYHFETMRECYDKACHFWKLFGVKNTKQSKNRPKDGKIHYLQLEKAYHK